MERFHFIWSLVSTPEEYTRNILKSLALLYEKLPEHETALIAAVEEAFETLDAAI